MLGVDEDFRAGDTASLAPTIARNLRDTGQTVATAETVTGGRIAAALSAAENAGEWFKGGVLACAADGNLGVLGVSPGPVITASAAQQMARGVAHLLEADYAVASTGTGGAGPPEDRSAGTVFIAVATPAGCSVERYRFAGEPSSVGEQASVQALQDLADATQCSADRTLPISIADIAGG